jgi:hypothetical protein
MKVSYLVIFLLSMMVFPLYSESSLASYAQMAERQQSPYLLHNAECVSYDGVIWTRNYGMKEYFLTPSYPDLHSSLQEIKTTGKSSGGHRLIRLELDARSRAQLAEFSVKIPAAYPFDTINVLLPAYYLSQLDVPYQELAYDATAKPENSRPANRQVIYEQGFEEDLGNEYEIDGWVDQPSIVFRNICWGIVNCASNMGDQSLWCAADLYDNGWYQYPPDPCTSYVNWMWTYFARLQTIDVTVAEELVFEWWSAYALDPAGDGDWCRVYIQDYPTTDWMMIAEYNNWQAWTDFQYELEGMSNVAYYFDFESDEQEFSGGVYIDDISIYNMVPNLTIGENSAMEYPYDYSTIEPHNLRIFYEVHNDSNVDVNDSFNVDFVLSGDNEYATDDDNFQLDEVTISEPVLAGESVSDELIFNLDTITIPGVGSLPIGNYYVIFYIDNNEDIDEYDEEDNQAASSGTISYGAVNLTYGDQSDITYPANPNTSQLQIDVHVINDGSEAAPDYFSVGYMLSDDYDASTLDDNYSLGTSTISEILQPGASAFATYSIDLEQTDVPAGDYWVFYFIDSGNAIPESNEYDNVWVSENEIDYLGAAYLEIDPLVLNFSAEAGNDNVNVSSNTSWAVTTSTGWITVIPQSGNGDAQLVVSVEANNVNEARTGTFTVSGAGENISVTVNQEAGTNLNYGDINDSGIVDAYDAALTLQYVVGLPTGIDPFPEILADVDGNGEVSAFDAGLIMQYVVGIIEAFPVQGVRWGIRE